MGVASDSNIAEQTLSKSSRKQQRCDTGALDVPPGGLTEFPDAEPMELGPHMVLPPVRSVEQAVPEPVVPAATVMPLSMLAPSLWGKGDPPASIMGKWPCFLGKTKAGQHPWYQVCDMNTVEFQNALQIETAIKGAECTLKQHAIINCMNKHEKALACANTTPPFMIPTSITKELADAMQVWTLNESKIGERR